MSTARKGENMSNTQDNEVRLAKIEAYLDSSHQTLLRIENSLDKVEDKISSLETKIENKINALETKLENKINNLEEKMDKKISSVDQKISSLETKIDEKIERLSNRLWIHFYWTVGGFASVLALVAHSLHWI